jgi:hypothetical protein
MNNPRFPLRQFPAVLLAFWLLKANWGFVEQQPLVARGLHSSARLLIRFEFNGVGVNVDIQRRPTSDSADAPK